MEAKLKEYRALRKRKELLEKTKDQIEKTKDKVFDLLTPNIFRDMGVQKPEEEVVLLEDEDSIGTNSIVDEVEQELCVTQEEIETEEPEVSWRYFTVKWLIITIIWLLLYALFIKLQFGAVFFVISLLIGICINTRTRPKQQGEVSAYSVFNKNCASIEGTTKAEDLQRQMLYGGRIF